MATIKDIAKMAGVSAMTVSNYLNGRANKLSEETAQKIAECIRRTGYTPNMYARSLVSNSSKVVTYIKIENESTDRIPLSDPFTALFLDSLEKSLSEIGYYLMLKVIASASDLTDFLGKWKVDGIVTVGLCDRQILNVLAESGLPVVLIDSYLLHERFVSIRIDDFSGAKMATEHLIHRGHKKVAAVAPSFRENSLNLVRLSGCRAAMKEAGISFSEALSYACDQCSITTIAGQILKSDATAVFAFSDRLAAELIREFHLAGKSVPEDISVIGFDDISLATLITPELTTIRQDTVEKGRIAAESITKMLVESEHNLSEIIMPVELIERKSVRKI
ncbi:MAG: LacI family transcriptional regulator [Ruminococcaceae bacterium]|nr:LacI family transcriptional regulator [Oscillospiraceae bacterium]